MENKVLILIRKLSDVFEGETWYGDSVMRKLENIGYQKVSESCVAGSNTIARIVAHMISWKKFTLEKLRENEQFDIIIDSETDWPEVEIHTYEEWENLKRDLVAVQSEIYEFLKNRSSESFLEREVPGRDYNFEYLLNGIMQHDIYHIGQISLIESQLNRSGISKEFTEVEK